MKIISDFTDYYDNVGGMYDEGLIWVRDIGPIENLIKYDNTYRFSEVTNFETSIDYLTKRISSRTYNSHPKVGEISFESVDIYVICGEVYYCVNFREGFKSEYYVNTKERIIRRWGKEHISENLTDSLWYDHSKLLKAALYHIERYDWISAHVEANSPIIQISNRSASANSELGNIGFASVVDPWTMACKMNAFVSCTLPNINEKEMITLSNDDKIKAHGFDLKKSFRHRK